jgi:SAM-dependent methyltransferase
LVARNIDRALKDFAAPMGRGKKLLDIGCGGQPLRATLVQMGFDYTGADVQQNAAGTVDVITAIDKPLNSTLSSRGPFDFIVCTEVLEHVADWDTAFKNLASLLKPGAKALITCPQFYPLHEVPYDFWRPTLYALRYFAQRVGLRVVVQEACGDGLDVVGTALASAKPIPKDRGWLSRAIALALGLARKVAFMVIRSKFIRKRITTGGSLYLSNLVILQRPTTAP